MDVDNLILFWERDDKGNLVSKPHTFSFSKDLLIDEVKKAEEAITKEKDEVRIAVLKRVVELLRQAHEESKKEITIRFIPLVEWELSCLSSKSSLINRGQTAMDSAAEICALKCTEPKYSYDDWVNTKTPQIKNAIAQEIIRQSTPPREKYLDKVDEGFLLLRGLLSQ
jgi:ubiquitin C-terminal hydrolase